MHCGEVGSFAVYSVHRDASFELSKSTFRQVFKVFIMGGTLVIFGGVRVCRHGFAGSRILNRNGFGIGGAGLTPWRMVEVASLFLVADLIALPHQ